MSSLMDNITGLDIAVDLLIAGILIGSFVWAFYILIKLTLIDRDPE
jgi:hypothetical protein